MAACELPPSSVSSILHGAARVDKQNTKKSHLFPLITSPKKLLFPIYLYHQIASPRFNSLKFATECYVKPAEILHYQNSMICKMKP
jgi:hypothetical protein